jgi:hypothetical protein
LLIELGGLSREDGVFIMQWDDASCPQRCLSEPPHSEEQQQDAYRELQGMNWDMVERGPSTSTMAASKARPAVVPHAARRQPRNIATASTIVKASTIESRNAAVTAGAAMDLVLDILVINRGIGIDADRRKLFEDAVKAVVLGSCGTPCLAITAPEDCNFMRFPVGHIVS